MSKDSIILPETRSWRDIPQQVKPRAMSREGKRRLALQVLRFACFVAALGIIGWGAWVVNAALRNPSALPESARSERIRSLVLVTDGVLDKEWLTKALALPADATLMGVDLEAIRSRLLMNPQVKAATLARSFPDALSVHLSERSPVARIQVQFAGERPAMLLVSRDGVAFEGHGFDPAMVESLPWVEGAKMQRTASGFAPVAGMAPVADLLAAAKLEAENLYKNWKVVSVARLSTDGVLEVRCKEGMRVIFGTTEDYLHQIARLDLLVDASTDPTRPLAVVDLSLGAQVPVAYGKAPPMLSDKPAEAPAASSVPQGPVILLPSYSNLQSEARRG